jgi:hypothetical protein
VGSAWEIMNIGGSSRPEKAVGRKGDNSCEELRQRGMEGSGAGERERVFELTYAHTCRLIS